MSGLVDFGISFVVLLGLMFFYGIAPTLGNSLVAPLMVFTLMTALSVGLVVVCTQC